MQKYFDDNPEITAYIQVKDLTNKNKNDVFVYNGWMFSSSHQLNHSIIQFMIFG